MRSSHLLLLVRLRLPFRFLQSYVLRCHERMRAIRTASAKIEVEVDESEAEAEAWSNAGDRQFAALIRSCRWIGGFVWLGCVASFQLIFSRDAKRFVFLQFALISLRFVFAAVNLQRLRLTRCILRYFLLCLPFFRFMLCASLKKSKEKKIQ